MDELLRRLRAGSYEAESTEPGADGLMKQAADEIEFAVTIIRGLVAFGHEPLPNDLLLIASDFLSRYRYRPSTQEQPLTNSNGIPARPVR